MSFHSKVELPIYIIEFILITKWPLVFKNVVKVPINYHERLGGREGRRGGNLLLIFLGLNFENIIMDFYQNFTEVQYDILKILTKSQKY